MLDFDKYKYLPCYVYLSSYIKSGEIYFQTWLISFFFLFNTSENISDFFTQRNYTTQCKAGILRQRI